MLPLVVAARTVGPPAVLLCLALLLAVVNLAAPNPFVSSLPDYLVLSFFCVALITKSD